MPDAPLSCNRNWRRWTRIALGLSVLLHLLLFLFVDLVYNPLALPEPRYRIQLESPTTRSFSEPVPSLAPNPLPIPSPHTAEIGAMGRAPALGVPGLATGQGEGVASQPGVASGLPGGEYLAGKAPAFVVPEVPVLDHDARLIDKMRQEIAEREQYVRFHILDADTTDDKSQRRSRARQIVERAIAAMGGREALRRIREMKARVWIEATEHCGRPYYLSGIPTPVQPYAFPVAFWRYTGATFTSERIQQLASFDPEVPNTIALVRDPCITLPKYYSLYESRWLGRSPAVKTLVGRQREQGEATRWHIVDHFLGEGVEVYYLTSEEYHNPYPRHETDLEDRGRGRLVDVIQVVDERYGQLQEALFDQETGLLLALREGLTPEEQRWFMMQYARKPPVWMTTYGHYQPVQGVLTPHRLVRGSNAPPVFVAIHLKISYNGDEPDRTEPDVMK